jgi:gamma-glutamylcyclotransferase (GGCT)/AIG2-like uncharacterized protein YtfP
MQNLFVYGTLLFKEIREGLCDKKMEALPAILHGYKRLTVMNCDYPAVIPVPKACVNGFLLKNVDAKSMALISFYEGEDYSTIKTEVETKEGIVQARVFVWKSDRNYLDTQDWDKDLFQENSLDSYVNEVVPATLKAFNQSIA